MHRKLQLAWSHCPVGMCACTLNTHRGGIFVQTRRAATRSASPRDAHAGWVEKRQPQANSGFTRSRTHNERVGLVNKVGSDLMHASLPI